MYKSLCLCCVCKSLPTARPAHGGGAGQERGRRWALRAALARRCSQQRVLQVSPSSLHPCCPASFSALSMPSALKRLMFFQNVVLCKAATHLSSTGKHLTLCLKRNFQPPYFSSLWSKGHNASCKLTARDSTQNRYHCTIHLASQILETDGYRVSLQGNFFGRNHMYIIFPEYNPCKHSKYEPGQLWAEALPSSSG